MNGGAGDPSCGKRAVGQRLVVSIDEDRRRNHHQQQIEPDVAHQAAPHIAPVDGAGDGCDALGFGVTRDRHSPPRARFDDAGTASVFDFGAQVRDVYVDVVGVAHVFVAQRFVRDALTREYGFGMRHKQCEDVELAGGQHDG